MHDEAPYFTLFAGIEQEKLRKSGSAAALQAFETAIYLIALGRWPAVITQVYLSIELLLRAHYRVPVGESGVNGAKLLDRYADEGKATQALFNRSQKLRKKRNQIVHNGYSPKDDSDSRRLFIDPAVPFFQNLLKSTIEVDLYDFPLTSEHAGHWFWENYKKCRCAAKACENAGGILSASEMLLFDAACRRVVEQAGRFESFFSPYRGYLDAWVSGRDQEAEFLARQANFEEFIEQFIDPSEVYILEETPCPVCQHEVLLFNASYSPENAELVIGVHQVGCLACRYLTQNEYIIGSYFNNAQGSFAGGVDYHQFRLANDHVITW